MTFIPMTISETGVEKIQQYCDERKLDWIIDGCVEMIVQTISFQDATPEQGFEWETGKRSPTGYVETIYFDPADIVFENFES